MIKSIRANNKATYDDFGLYIASRNIPFPQNKEIHENIPFMNGSYDFSYVVGEIAKEDRIISYVVDIAEYSIEEMDLLKRNVANWLSTIVDVDIFDDYIENYHFHGTALVPDWSEENSQGQMNINFRVYPYMISNNKKSYIETIDSEKIINIENNSSHIIYPKIICTNNLKITYDNISYSFVQGEYEDTDIRLYPGNNSIILEGNATVTIEFFEEVL